MDILNGKTVIVMGVANKNSIAWGCAQAIMASGGKVVLTYQNDRLRKSLLRFVDPDQPMVQCDVADEGNIDAAFTSIREQYGPVDGLVHAIAYADKESLENDVLQISKAGYNLAQDISAYSFLAVTRSAVRLFPELRSVLTLTYFGSTHVIPNYNIMGVAKAALEANVRYTAKELGPQHVRVNAISAGAIKTLAVTGVKNHGSLLKMSREATVDGESVTQEEIGNTAALLLSDMSSGVTGDIIYVDKGVHLM
ncbi:enoyl-[acyl-carrier-protein] reductase [Lacticaseibacillus pantheris DSM 15945 = JCM 12539 = NBRC 106106]|uniref:Enoyl-[acyl-carrier-protein] reductase [NADH] n=1 Tax=Lacticaseibacillus pantheris DSM 15945 = JCM 12539 = NBRC 106106 TaxID=1423783 RepID=A0A0R1TT53_9LACO|nr:enoyl-ACP reductase FabI [Lacticaseibacillus pantheris]KRL84495.1 enoyl-[acyl-carrier-protein] reductase [Lacticaseibacillus pantheris DSM 15945 = JCM 12539 = NBRC 106106]